MSYDTTLDYCWDILCIANYDVLQGKKYDHEISGLAIMNLPFKKNVEYLWCKITLN